MKNKPRKVLIAAPVHPVLINGFTERGYECVMSENISQAKAYGLVGDCTGIITSTRLQLDKGLIDAAPQLEWIGRMGSGMEVIDLEYAASKNISCYSSPEGNCNAVGEHALGMLLALIRRITWSHNELAGGVWRRDENRGIELEGKTIGIIGYGHTGQAFSKKLLGFDTRILAYDKYSMNNIPSYITACKTLQPIFDEADIVSFHVPMQADTIHYFNAAFVSQMRKPFIIVNTSRGTVVDSIALLHGLTSGKVIGACLDVHEQEPLKEMNGAIRSAFDEMVHFQNVIMTPHIAGYTFEALYKMSKTLIDKIEYQT